MSEMSPEKSPDKENKFRPMKDNCDNCEQDYPLTNDNAHVYHHAEQQECDFIECKCPNCKYVTRIFIPETTLENAIRGHFNLTVDKYASDEIHSQWLQVKGYELPPTYELTDRHEDSLRKFGDTLLAIPDDIFWDNIEAETARPYPQKWI